jgi:hypothetical protein
MCDFLKAFPFVSREEYLWEYSIPMIKIMSADASHTLYLSEKQAKDYHHWKMAHDDKVFDDPTQFLNDLGLPIFDKK